MLQNPHPCPRRHAPTLASCSHLGVTLPPRRHVPLVVRRCSARPCWASGMELMAGVATSLGGPRWRRGGLASSATALVADEALRPIGKSRPLLIGWSLPDHMQFSRLGGIFLMGRGLSEELRRESASPMPQPLTVPGTNPSNTKCPITRFVQWPGTVVWRRSSRPLWLKRLDPGGKVLTTDAGWSSSVARRAHNPEVAGSNPVPATTTDPVP